MKRGSGTTKITLVEVEKKDMLFKEVTKSTFLDMIEWVGRIDVADFDYFVEDP